MIKGGNRQGADCFLSRITMSKTIQIQYINDKIKRLEYIDGKSDWIDLRSSEHVEMKAGEFRLINLGVAMKLPDGYSSS